MELNNIAHIINFSNKLELRKESISDDINNGVNIIEKVVLILEHSSERYTYGQLIDFISDLLNYQESIIAGLRRPWRWDHARNMEIRNRLVSKG